MNWILNITSSTPVDRDPKKVVSSFETLLTTTNYYAAGTIAKVQVIML